MKINDEEKNTEVQIIIKELKKKIESLKIKRKG